MHSNYSKILHPVLNRPIIEYVVKAAEDANVDEIILVTGKNRKELETYFQDRVKYVEQPLGAEHPYGTGFAVKQGLSYIEKEDSVLILCGDAPLFRGEGLRKLLEHREKQKEAARAYGAFLEEPFGYGRLVTRKDKLLRIVEERDATEEEKRISLVNSGVFAFSGEALFYALDRLDTENAQGEMYLTDAVAILIEKGETVGLEVLEDASEMLGINSRIQLAQVEKMMRKRVNEYHMSRGITMENPETTVIEPGVLIGRDTYLEGGVRITGKTMIGEECRITSGSILKDATLGDRVIVRQSVLEECRVERDTDIGPFARLRPGTWLKERVHIGNFVEIKNATLGADTKAGHLAYIGDADVGEDVNIGCGVVFANYNGKEKFRTEVGDRAFLGSNANLVAPLVIGEEAFIAAGSTVTKDVEAGALGIERTKLKMKPGWVAKKNQGGEKK